MFRTSRAKAGLLLLGSVVAAALAFMLLDRRPLLALSGGAFFVLCSIAALASLSRNRFYLKLAPEGLEIAAFLRKSRFKWSEVEAFHLTSIRGTKIIPVIPKVRRDRNAWSQVNIGNHYISSLEGICESLNAWRARHGSAA